MGIPGSHDGPSQILRIGFLRAVGGLFPGRFQPQVVVPLGLRGQPVGLAELRRQGVRGFLLLGLGQFCDDRAHRPDGVAHGVAGLAVGNLFLFLRELFFRILILFVDLFRIDEMGFLFVRVLVGSDFLFLLFGAFQLVEVVLQLLQRVFLFSGSFFRLLIGALCANSGLQGIQAGQVVSISGK